MAESAHASPLTLSCYSENHFMDTFNTSCNFIMVGGCLLFFSSGVNEHKLTQGYISRLDPQHIEVRVCLLSLSQSFQLSQ